MAKLPSSFRNRNQTSRRFREQLASLPPEILGITKKCCRFFDRNPTHPSLRHHQLRETKTGMHVPGSFSVSINKQYRAIYFVGDNSINVWYWIGTHSEYDIFTGNG